MKRVEELANEFRFQLKQDILAFGWMLQVARLQHPGGVEADWVNAVFDAVVRLKAGEEIVVGTARNIDGKVQIEAWPEQGRKLRERLAQTSESSVGLDRDFCFWIGMR